MGIKYSIIFYWMRSIFFAFLNCTKNPRNEGGVEDSWQSLPGQPLKIRGCWDQIEAKQTMSIVLSGFVQPPAGGRTAERGRADPTGLGLNPLLIMNPSSVGSPSTAASTSASWFSGLVRGGSKNMSASAATTDGGSVPGSRKNQLPGVLFKYGPKSVQVTLRAATESVRICVSPPWFFPGEDPEGRALLRAGISNALGWFSLNPPWIISYREDSYNGALHLALLVPRWHYHEFRLAISCVGCLQNWWFQAAGHLHRRIDRWIVSNWVRHR